MNAQPDFLLEVSYLYLHLTVPSFVFSSARCGTAIVEGGLGIIGLEWMYSLPISFPARVDGVDLGHHGEAYA